MVGKNCIKYTMRTPAKTVLFILLIALTTCFLALGLGLWQGSRELLYKADQTFTTVGMIEYVGGDYPDETSFDQKSVNDIVGLDLKDFLEHDAVKGFTGISTGLAGIEGIKPNINFSMPYLEHSIIRFKVMYVDGENVRGTLINSVYYYDDKKEINFDILPAEDPAEDFKLEKGRVYLAHGRMRRISGSYYFQPMEVEFTDHIEEPAAPYIMDVTDTEDISVLPSWPYWQQVAHFYENANRSIPVTAADDLSLCPGFYLGEKTMKSGRIFTPEEYSEEENVCIISVNVAGVLGLEVGDTLTMNLLPSENPLFFYEGCLEDTGQPEKYTVVGIYQTYRSDVETCVYIPRTARCVLPDTGVHYYRGTVKLDNQAAREYQQEIAGMLPENYKFSVFDQGYAQAAAPIMALQRSAWILTAVCILCGLAVLALFGGISIGKQQETMKIMLSLGSGGKKTWCYLVGCTGITAAAGCLIGGGLGAWLSESMARQAYALAVSRHSQDLRFSIRAIGEQHIFSEQIHIAGYIPAVSAALILFTALMIGGIMSALLIRRQEASDSWFENKKKKTKPLTGKNMPEAGSLPIDAPAHVHPTLCVSHAALTGKMSLRMGFFNKQVVRSMVRDKRRCLLAALISMVITLFLAIYAGFLASSQSRLDSVYEDVPVTAYFATNGGTNYSMMFLPDSLRDYMDESLFVADTYKTGSLFYDYVGKSDEITVEKRIEVMEAFYRMGAFAQESRRADVRKWSDKIYFTEDIARSPEFFNNLVPEVNYGENGKPVNFGADLPSELYEQRTASYGNRTKMNEVIGKMQEFAMAHMECLVTETFLKTHGLEIGDSICIEAILLSDYYYSNVLDVKIAGTFKPLKGGDSIYMPYVTNLVMPSGYIPDMGYELTANYDLKQTERLDVFRDEIEQLGITPVGVTGESRVSLVINDAALTDVISSLNDQISFMNTLYPALIVLVLAVGFVVSYLTVRTRKAELALYRSMGNGRLYTFAMILAEQILQAFAGILAGCAAALILIAAGLSPAGLTVSLVLESALRFLTCYLVGSAAAVFVINRNNIMEILMEKE